MGNVHTHDNSPVVLRPGCKVNLYLEILGREPDGYHTLDTLFYPLVSPCDVLTISLGTEEGLDLTCSSPSLRTEDNILYRAYVLFARSTGYAPALSVHLEKHIPMGGGLGGGSSDAAFFLGYLNSIAGTKKLSASCLADLGLALGADVPFFLKNRPCWAEGRGERLRETTCNLDPYFPLLICPDVHVATAWAYTAWDRHGLARDIKKNTSQILTRQNRADRYPSSRRNLILYNDFEGVVLPEYPVLYDLKLAMLALGACGCVMSGSGASLFALFDRENIRERACSHLRAAAISYFI